MDIVIWESVVENRTGAYSDRCFDKLRSSSLSLNPRLEGGEKGYANPLICYNLLTKSTLPLSPWIRNLGKNILITHQVQILGPKIEESPIRCNCRIWKKMLKSRFESKIWAKYLPILSPFHPPLDYIMAKLFVNLHVIFDSMDGTLWCYHLNETSLAEFAWCYCRVHTQSWIIEKVLKFVQQFSRPGKSLENRDEVCKNW